MHKIISGVLLTFFIGISALYPTTGHATKIALIGDDFVNGAGLFSPSDTFAAQLPRFMGRKKLDIKDYSQTGATTASTYSRIDAIVADEPQIAILAIGLNDALAGVNPDVVYSNLDNILRELERAGIYTLFVTMQTPPSINQTYAMSFNAIYAKVAQQHKVVILDQFYSPIFSNSKLTQMDRLHPNKFGVQVMARKTSLVIQEMLKNMNKLRRCTAVGAKKACNFK